MVVGRESLGSSAVKETFEWGNMDANNQKEKRKHVREYDTGQLLKQHKKKTHAQINLDIIRKRKSAEITHY